MKKVPWVIACMVFSLPLLLAAFVGMFADGFKRGMDWLGEGYLLPFAEYLNKKVTQ